MCQHSLVYLQTYKMMHFFIIKQLKINLMLFVNKLAGWASDGFCSFLQEDSPIFSCGMNAKNVILLTMLFITLKFK